MKSEISLQFQESQDHDVLLRGKSICVGVSLGHVHIVDPDLSVISTNLTQNQVDSEMSRYTKAVIATRKRLREHVEIVHGNPTQEMRAILEIHEAMLRDETFHDRVRKRIATHKKNAEWCLWQEASSLISRFTAMRDPYFEARGEDVRDMAHNLINILSESHIKMDQWNEDGKIFVSRHLHTSDAILAQRTGSIGFASESHALVSHGAILLKGLGIPTVAGIETLTKYAREGDLLLVDGTNASVVLRPSEDTLEKHRSSQEKSPPLIQKAQPKDCITADGSKILLRANLENPEQVVSMHAQGLDGIGLFRTEFLVPSDGSIPSEEEQYKIYRSIIQKADGKLVVIRTFDLGGDKSTGLMATANGRNPALGIRGIRRHLIDRPDELKAQLRAIFKAAIGSNVGVLIPMVTNAQDLIATRNLWQTAAQELMQKRTPFSKQVKLGSMIETPSAAVGVEEIVAQVDFISIGTNDLLQYFMAADRDNEHVIHYQDASSPPFLWLMRHIIDRLKKLNRAQDVTVCGEVASDVRVFPHLVGMGYTVFSVSPVDAKAFRAICSRCIPNASQHPETEGPMWLRSPPEQNSSSVSSREGKKLHNVPEDDRS